MITALREWRVGTDSRGAAVTLNRLWWLDRRVVAPICAVAVYVAIVLVRLPSALSSLYQYSDFPEALRLGDAVFHGGWGQGLAVPSQSGIGPLWIVGLLSQLTRGEAAGMALGAGTVVVASAFMVAAARRILGWTPAIAVGALCVAAPPVVAWQMLTPIGHESTLLLTAVCAWQLVGVSQATDRNRTVASSTGIGALAGICIVSDPLALVAAVTPWVISSSLLVRGKPGQRVALLITAGATVASAAAMALLSNAAGLVAHGNAVVSPSVDGITSGLRTTASTLGQMLTGAWYGDALGAGLAIAGFAAFAVVLYIAAREVRRPNSFPEATGRDTYVRFWVVSSAALIAALCVSGLGIQHSPLNYQGHYVDGLWFAIAALLPIGLLRAGLVRRVVAIAVPGLILAAALGIARMPAIPFQGPDYADGPQLVATLQQLGVTRGYGGYWESYAIGWHTDQHITALPLQQCSEGGVPGVCRYEFAAPAWYVAQPGAVFVIVLRGSCTRDALCLDASNLAALPSPEVVRNVGLLQIDVYAQDVFARLPMASRP